ncbi:MULTISPECIES: hypothetical protein [Enterococcus]|uniref:hypothetical protein n=1 Tax=Enterococcus TaxID=1350 RepID=UPI0012E04AEE|nr:MULTISPECIES: hypothetical protein [Enterococcus]
MKIELFIGIFAVLLLGVSFFSLIAQDVLTAVITGVLGLIAFFYWYQKSKNKKH